MAEISKAAMLRRAVYLKAKEGRRITGESGILNQIKKILNTHFGELNNEIVNINESQAIDLALNYLGISLGPDGDENNPDDTNIEHLLEVVDKYLFYEVVIRFPEVEIKNEHDASHIIRDLFVSFNINFQGCLFSVDDSFLNGIRSTVTVDELKYNYAHSHLPRVDYRENYDGHFCLGTGSILDVILQLKHRFYEDGMELFCLHIKELVKWESISGVPYRYISEIGVSEHTTSGPAEDFPAEQIPIICNHFLFHLSSLRPQVIRDMFSVKIIEDKFDVELTDRGQKEIVTVMERMNLPLQCYAVKNHQGKLIRISPFEIDTTQYKMTEPILYFQNKPINFKIVDYENASNEIRKYPDPEFTRFINTQLSDRFNSYALQRNSLLPINSGICA
ncbi:hypothetical protein SAMN05428988_3251 [Chitinophaga sp. YR573]|uniref:hypothetical protein n=1 Tax=Chitinophaga sp. YR573 TaxID=1881040 RepID=UPI0008C099E7|nr:hypothetical protein [Chitinophaga sp. YR573]SEW21806.1 hypothetical protein SAMN05428988_3251 [Chitinophaga sp. YR573]